MKLIDNRGRLFGKISLIDLLVIFVVVAFAAGLFVRNFALERKTTDLGEYRSIVSEIFHTLPLIK